MGIDMEQFFLASRRELQQNRRVPPVFHEFWLRDMDHANSEYCRFLSKGKATPTHFFLAVNWELLILRMYWKH